MTVIIVAKTNWEITTIHNVTSITLANHTFTIVGDTTKTASEATHFVRIMG